MAEVKKIEVIRRPLMSGHCAVGNESGHEMCNRNGGGQRANPLREWQPCPCPCHYVDDVGELEVFECGECGRDIVAAPLWPLDEDGEVRYTHIDSDARATGEGCDTPETKRKPANEPDPEKDCSRCGSLFRGKGRGRLCPSCIAEDEAEEDDFSDLDDLDDDDFSDLDDL